MATAIVGDSEEHPVSTNKAKPKILIFGFPDTRWALTAFGAVEGAVGMAGQFSAQGRLGEITLAPPGLSSEVGEVRKSATSSPVYSEPKNAPWPQPA